MRSNFELIELTNADRDAVVGLMRRCLAVDGGLPTALQPAFLDRLFFSGPARCVRTNEGELLGVIALATKTEGEVSATGIVDPSVRGQGIGTTLLTWAREVAGTSPLQLRSETLSESVRSFCEGAGYRQVFGEYVMRANLFNLVAPEHNEKVWLLSWRRETKRQFFEAYENSFRERPGYPGWTYEAWTAAIEDNDNFDATSSYVAIDMNEVPVSFIVTCGDWIDLVGTVPGARRTGIAASLTLLAMVSMRDCGHDKAWLNVEVKNEGAIALYKKLGFETNGERGFFQ